MRATAVDASHRRAATLSRQGGAVGGAADPPLAVRRGKAFSRSPASRTLPTGSARRGGSRAETTGRATPVAAVGGTPKRDGSAWGRSPRPRKQKARASGSAQTRPACRAETLARALSATLKAWSEGRGRRHSLRVGRGVQPQPESGSASSRGKRTVPASRRAAVRSPCSIPVARGDEQLAALYES